MIDWTNEYLQISKYFTVREAIFLPTWGRLANQLDGLNDDVNEALLFMFAKLDIVRDFIGAPIRVHVAYRPAAYNQVVRGAPDSSHIARIEDIAGERALIAAVDWSADVGETTVGENCDTLRSALAPKLEEFGLRMEDQPLGSGWIHLDSHPVLPGHERYFKP